MKELMKKDLIEFINNPFLKEAQISIENISLKLNNDERIIDTAIDECYHDKYSDIDIKLRFNKIVTITLDDLKINKIFGIKYEESEDGLVIRLVKNNGVRYDIVLLGIRNFETIKQERTVLNKKNQVLSVMALGKLMRSDYLIADHLAHMLCMEVLVEQMVDRDVEKGTNNFLFYIE